MLIRLLKDTRVHTVSAICGAKVIARQLELCFGTDANDLDLSELQALFNSQLLSLLQVSAANTPFCFFIFPFLSLRALL